MTIEENNNVLFVEDGTYILSPLKTDGKQRAEYGKRLIDRSGFVK